MSSATRRPVAESGSRTLTLPQERRTTSPTNQPENEAGPSNPTPAIGVLKLRGGPARRQKVVWSDKVIDNEGMGKKKSKICCIYHRPKAYDESSSESSSEEELHQHTHVHRGKPVAQAVKGEKADSQSSESEGGGGDGRARPPKRRTNHAKANKYDSRDRTKGKTNVKDV